MPADLEVHSQFRSLATQEARQTFLDALANDPRRGQKARIAAIAILYERGVTDYATLNLANRLSDDDAIALARHLATLPEKATAGAIANDAFLKALAEKPPKPVKEADQAYVPALSNEDFNRGIKESFLNNKLLPGYRILAAQTADIVRGRHGGAFDAALEELVNQAESWRNLLAAFRPAAEEAASAKIAPPAIGLTGFLRV